MKSLAVVRLLYKRDKMLIFSYLWYSNWARGWNANVYVGRRLAPGSTTRRGVSVGLVRIMSTYFGRHLRLSEKWVQISDVDLKAAIGAQIDADSTRVWTPADFLDLGSRDAVDKTLQRLARADQLRRIDRGLYDKPRTSQLTKRPSPPDYRQLIDALARRDQVRMLVDGLTAANDLGLTTAVPARVVLHTDARRRSIKVGNLTIDFKRTAPSKLYWAGHPAMRVVQALHWLKDTFATDHDRITKRLSSLLADPAHGPALRDDLRSGLKTLPTWMQRVVRELLVVDDDHLHQHHHDDAAVDHRGQDTQPLDAQHRDRSSR